MSATTVLVIGALPGQGRRLRAALAASGVGLDWLETGRSRGGVRPGYACYVVWTRFCSHQLQLQAIAAAVAQQRRAPGGGLVTMAERILKALGREA
jgi:hypothetical protein